LRLDRRPPPAGAGVSLALELSRLVVGRQERQRYRQKAAPVDVAIADPLDAEFRLHARAAVGRKRHFLNHEKAGAPEVYPIRTSESGDKSRPSAEADSGRSCRLGCIGSGQARWRDNSGLNCHFRAREIRSAEEGGSLLVRHRVFPEPDEPRWAAFLLGNGHLGADVHGARDIRHLGARLEYPCAVPGEAVQRF
jgi:hypothetical protein